MAQQAPSSLIEDARKALEPHRSKLLENTNETDAVAFIARKENLGMEEAATLILCGLYSLQIAIDAGLPPLL
jgi:hypothetical protein